MIKKSDVIDNDVLDWFGETKDIIENEEKKEDTDINDYTEFNNVIRMMDTAERINLIGVITNIEYGLTKKGNKKITLMINNEKGHALFITLTKNLSTNYEVNTTITLSTYTNEISTFYEIGALYNPTINLELIKTII